jgi:thymidylate synthase
MAYLISGESSDSITSAWLTATEYLSGRGRDREEFGLVVEIVEPAPAAADPRIIATLNDFLRQRGYFSVETVANTIFPDQLAATSNSREQLYSRYLNLLARLRKLRKNKRGLYFERLIKYPLQSNPDRANQVEMVIKDLRAQLERRRQGQGALGSIYEAQVFAPGMDRVPIGFPCMSSLSFQLDGHALRLTATYRNQYYIQKALGNFLGLSQLQCFIADAAGLQQGPLTLHAFHACIDPQVSKSDVAGLIRRCRDLRLPLVGRQAA